MTPCGRCGITSGGVRAVLGFERRRAAQRGACGGVGGAVTAIQRFGSALNTNVYFHPLTALLRSSGS
jgi:hypothetical protein